jgi:hypothetical protein
MEIKNSLCYNSGVIFFALNNFLFIWSWKTILGVDHTPPCCCGYRNKIVAVAVAVELQTATNFQFF